MKNILCLTLIIFPIIAKSEPKFRFDSRNSPDKEKEEKQVKPERPAYYDLYKKGMTPTVKSPQPQQQPAPTYPQSPNDNSQASQSSQSYQQQSPQINQEAIENLKKQLQNIDPKEIQKIQDQYMKAKPQ